MIQILFYDLYFEDNCFTDISYDFCVTDTAKTLHFFKKILSYSFQAIKIFKL